jgi:hypothetical protein
MGVGHGVYFAGGADPRRGLHRSSRRTGSDREAADRLGAIYVHRHLHLHLGNPVRDRGVGHDKHQRDQPDRRPWFRSASGIADPDDQWAQRRSDAQRTRRRHGQRRGVTDHRDDDHHHGHCDPNWHARRRNLFDLWRASGHSGRCRPRYDELQRRTIASFRDWRMAGFELQFRRIPDIARQPWITQRQHQHPLLLSHRSGDSDQHRQHHAGEPDGAGLQLALRRPPHHVSDHDPRRRLPLHGFPARARRIGRHRQRRGQRRAARLFGRAGDGGGSVRAGARLCHQGTAHDAGGGPDRRLECVGARQSRLCALRHHGGEFRLRCQEPQRRARRRVCARRASAARK